ncbi:MAG: hypothetical protein WCF30_02120 [Terracidiphilus sp.]
MKQRLAEQREHGRRRKPAALDGLQDIAAAHEAHLSAKKHMR